MAKLCQINTVVNSGSTGHIAEIIGNISQTNGLESVIAFGRNPKESNSITFKIGNKLDFFIHVLLTRVFDKHGCGSIFATIRLIKYLTLEKPDIIHLHNIHGYYINYGILFNWLKKKKLPVVWTLHDCWTYTGHCAYYSFVKCDKWKKNCEKCRNKSSYPASYFFSNSKINFIRKKNSFTKLERDNLILVTPSNWLCNELKESFLNKYECAVINNGVDLSVFKPNSNYLDSDCSIILGVASIWEKRKGFNDFLELSKYLSSDERIVLIGLNESQIKQLPNNIIGIKRTENQEELALWYSKSLVFINPTYEDNFPTTNLESLACGTPVITYNTDGSPETVGENTGFVLEKGDIKGLYNKIQFIKRKGKINYVESCRKFAEEKYDISKNYQEYIKIYKKMLEINSEV